MFKFNKITIQNFLSFGNKPTVIDLNTNNITLLIGENRDTGAEGYSRNGVGKSSIFQAITWVLFNEGITNIKQDAFVNIINKKNLLITLEFEQNGNTYVLKRGRKPNICELTRNGEPFTLHSTNSVDETIEKLIGISYDTFVNTVMLNTNTISFMNMKPAAQRNFMEQMLGLNLLSERANILKTKLKDLSVEIRLEEQNKEHVIQVYNKTLERIEQLQQRSKEWIEKHEDEIKDLKNILSELEKFDIDDLLSKISIRKKAEAQYIALKKDKEALEENKQNEINETVSKLETQIINIEYEYNLMISELSEKFNKEKLKVTKEFNEELKKVYEAKSLLKEVQNTIKTLENTIKQLSKNNKTIESEIENLESGECPYCHQPHFDKNKVEELKTILENNKNEIKESEETINELKKEEKQLLEKAEKETDIKTRMDTYISEREDFFNKMVSEYREKENEEINRFKNKITRAKEEIEKLYQEKESKILEDIETCKRTIIEYDEFSEDIIATIEAEKKSTKNRLNKLESESNPYNEQLEAAKSELIEYDDSKLYEMKELEDHYKVLIKLLTDNKSFVRKNMLDQFIPYINKRVEYYIEELELMHRIKFNNDLSIDIDYMGSSVSYGNMSNGEKNRLNFAVSMAFRDLLHVTNNQMNLLCIDELLDNGIDQSGFMAIFELLKRRENESVFIISHRDDLLTHVDSIMHIVKQNGFTRIENNVN